MSYGEKATKRFVGRLQDAHVKFLEFEEKNGGIHRDYEVRAAQFSHFVCQNYPGLAEEITPDKCSKHLEDFRFITYDQAPPQPLNDAQRHGKACLAYAEFRQSKFYRGAKIGEAMAFERFVHLKYPNTLPGFDEDEAKKTIAAMKRQTLGRIGYIAAAVFAGILASVIMLRSGSAASEDPSMGLPLEPEPGLQHDPERERRLEAQEPDKKIQWRNLINMEEEKPPPQKRTPW